MRFVIRDRETGTEIIRFKELADAKMMLEDFEMQDKLDGTYQENFYEIYDYRNIGNRIDDRVYKRSNICSRNYVIRMAISRE